MGGTLSDLGTTAGLVIGGWLVLGFLCSMWRLYRAGSRLQSVDASSKTATHPLSAKAGKPEQSGRLKYAACNSPECVRCHKYIQVRSEAYSKLVVHAKRTNFTGLDRLYKALLHSEDAYLKKNQQPNVLYIPDLEACPVWNDSSFFCDEKYILEQNTESILWEFLKVYEDIHLPNSGWIKNSTPTGTWNIYSFYNQGSKALTNCKNCPKTVAIIELLPNFMKDSLLGNASFSVLSPGTHIEEHFGPTNARIRCHLGLQVPVSQKCSLTVAGETLQWKKGACFFFDDSFLHSASNEGPGVRVVLMIDMWHPDLTDREKTALKHVF